MTIEPQPTNECQGKNQYFQCSDSELLDLLRHAWQIPQGEDIVLVGFISDGSFDAGGGRFAFANQLTNPITNEKVTFPGGFDSAVHISGKLINSLYRGKWVKVTCTLSQSRIRKEKENPFALTANSVSLLTNKPSWLSLDLVSSNQCFAIPDSSIPLIEEAYLEFIENQFSKQKEKVDNKLEHFRIQVEKEIVSIEESLEHSQNQISSYLQKEKSLKITINDKQNELEELEVKLEKLKAFLRNRMKLLQRLDLLDPEDEEILDPRVRDEKTVGYSFKTDLNEDFETLVSYIQKFAYNKGFFYKKTVLRDFLALIRTNDLIVLAGDSGTGKSSLCRVFADAVGGESIVIPVKPNWTSNEDLMGYYNPIEHKYLATPFLDALRRAENEPYKLFIICLDEMNIARVEYYFADFLSLLEERSKTPIFDLFTPSDLKALRTELSNFITLAELSGLKTDSQSKSTFIDLLKNESSRNQFIQMCGIGEAESLLKYHGHLKSRLQNSLEIPNKIALPANVRIVGTVNFDDTTYYLSPKILDRVNVIKFSGNDQFSQGLIDNELDAFEGYDLSMPVSIDVEKFGQRTPYPNINIESEVGNFFKHLSEEYLSHLGIEFGYRSVRQALAYQLEMEVLFDTDAKTIINNIVLHKVLPKVILNGLKTYDGVSNRDRVQSMCDLLSRELGPECDCVKKLEQIIKKSDVSDGQINYWIK